MFFISVSQPIIANNFNFSFEEEKFINENQKLTLCTTLNGMPHEEIISGQYIGINADFIKEISERLTIRIKIVKISPTQLKNNATLLQSCDLIYTNSFSEINLKDFILSQSYFSSPLVFTTTNKKNLMTSIEAFYDKKLGFPRNSHFIKEIISQHSQINWIEVDSIDQAMNLISKNKLDGYINSLMSISYFLQNNYYPNLKINASNQKKIKFQIATHKQDFVLKNLIAKVINNISDERKKQIKNSWIKIKYDHRNNNEILFFIILIVSILFFSLLYCHIILRRHAKKLKKISQTDKLTNLYNRVKTDEALMYHFNSFRRYGDLFSIILLDIDNFKKINDIYGHIMGDKVLTNVAKTLILNCRNTDIIGRWGGEEFLVICPKTGINEALQITEKLRTSIENILLEKRINIQNKDNITASFGVTETQIEDTQNSLILRADKALLKAKRNGKNQSIPAINYTTQKLAVEVMND